ncbi:MAG: hypothetical protein KF826_09425 [Xanthobacteraceae bacterium]|nr:hypothetical protein [Xanthobacteraceae bacterium]
MLRWFKNYVNISGSPDRISSLVKSNFDFDQIVPEPHLDDDNTKIFNWRCDNWGSVWAHNFRVISQSGDQKTQHVFVSFDSFAAPPLPIWEALEKQGLSVQASFDEQATQMSGDYREGQTQLFYRDGVVTLSNNAINYETYPTLDEYLEHYRLFEKFYLISANAYSAKSPRQSETHK